MKDKYKTLILACWIVLLSCFIIKILGGNFFEIVCNNKTFINICDFIDTSFIKYLVVSLCYTFGTSLYFLAVLNKTKFKNKENILYIILPLFSCLKLLFAKYSVIVFIIDLIFTIITPIIINKRKWLNSIIGYILIIIFQLISLLTKNIGIKIIDNSTLTSLIFCIDYYIMIILYYLYNTKRKENENGSFWNCVFRRKRQ